MPRLMTLMVAAAATCLPASLVHAERLIGLTTDQRIVMFDSQSPATIMTSHLITGLIGGDVLTGIDLRPANSLIYGVAASSGRIYTLTNNGLATLISTMSVAPVGTRFGIDFNPVPDRLRLISDTDQNLRINVATGATTVDTAVTRSGGGAINVTGSAYTNAVPGGPAPASTQLFGIDTVADVLVTSAAPNGGVYSNVGSLGVAIAGEHRIGFDISGRTGNAFLSVENNLYGVNLATGSATLVGAIGSGPLIGLTALGAVPEPAAWAMMILGLGMVGHSFRSRRPRMTLA